MATHPLAADVQKVHPQLGKTKENTGVSHKEREIANRDIAFCLVFFSPVSRSLPFFLCALCSRSPSYFFFPSGLLVSLLSFSPLSLSCSRSHHSLPQLRDQLDAVQKAQRGPPPPPPAKGQPYPPRPADRAKLILSSFNIRCPLSLIIALSFTLSPFVALWTFKSFLFLPCFPSPILLSLPFVSSSYTTLQAVLCSRHPSSL